MINVCERVRQHVLIDELVTLKYKCENFATKIVSLNCHSLITKLCKILCVFIFIFRISAHLSCQICSQRICIKHQQTITWMIADNSWLDSIRVGILLMAGNFTNFSLFQSCRITFIYIGAFTFRPFDQTNHRPNCLFYLFLSGVELWNFRFKFPSVNIPQQNYVELTINYITTPI